MSSCVVRGTAADVPTALPSAVEAWSGRLSNPDITWSVARGRITRSSSTVAALVATADQADSPYRSAFRQGAILVPRYLLFVREVSSASPLGAGAGRVAVESQRSTLEKPPWRGMPSLTGTVERRFVRDVYLGESIAPYRTLEPRRAVVPASDSAILTRSVLDEAPGITDWWGKVETAWEGGRRATEQQPLLSRFDYHAQLSSQLPGAATRVVYSKAGNTLVAARLTDARAIIDHKLYWAATSSADEARYLVAILNSGTLLSRVAPLQTRGLFGARDFDKHIFAVPIPTFDANDAAHLELASLADAAERAALAVPVRSGDQFQTVRKAVRDALSANDLSREIELRVASIVPPA